MNRSSMDLLSGKVIVAQRWVSRYHPNHALGKRVARLLHMLCVGYLNTGSQKVMQRIREHVILASHCLAPVIKALASVTPRSPFPMGSFCPTACVSGLRTGLESLREQEKVRSGEHARQSEPYPQIPARFVGCGLTKESFCLTYWAFKSQAKGTTSDH